jgi:hypothetical protein
MSRKQKDLDQARVSESTNSRELTRHICYVCQRSRSWRYHSSHPPGKRPSSRGVCRRCVREEKSDERPQPSPQITIYEIHHYHHDCRCKQKHLTANTPVELPLQSAYPRCAELPAKYFRDRKGGSLSPKPPPANFQNKPRSWSR